ncbi:MAG: tetratricopeptide repeat protein [Bacteroidia bacterium]|nr:tetratricopeptide repeat protein [Bacteroidia bacterium]
MKASGTKCFLFFFLLHSTFISFSQNRKADSLLRFLKTAKEDTNKLISLNLLTDQLRKTSNFDTALAYAQQAKDLAEKLITSSGEGTAPLRSAKKGITDAYNNMGLIYADRANYPEALKNYSIALRMREDIGFRKGVAGTHIHIGTVYWNQGNYPFALKSFFAALKIFEETGNKKGIADAYTSLGNIYANQENYPEALKNYSAALKMQEITKSKKGKAWSHNNIGLVYWNQRNFAGALKNYSVALKLFEDAGDKNGIAASYSNIGLIYFDTGDYAGALKNYLAALEIQKKAGNMLGIAYSYTNAGGAELKLNNIKAAKNYFKSALLLAAEIGSKEIIKDSYQGLTELYSATGKYKEALENNKLYIAYRDSVLNEENTKKTIQSQMQYDFDKRSAADSIKNSEAKKFEEIKHQQEIARQKTFTYGGIAGFLIMIVVAGISYFAFRNKKKANAEITRQKHLVEEKQKEILDSIYYARRIQRALLAPEFYINRELKRLNRNT